MSSSRIITGPEVDEFFAFLQQNDRAQDAQDLSAVLGHVALLEKQLAGAIEELRGVRQELAKLQEPGPIMAAWQKLADRLHIKIAAVHGRLRAVKGSITNGTRKTLAAVKQGGIAAVDGAVRFTHAKEMLQWCSQNLKGAAKDAADTARQVSQISRQYHEAGKHLRNFGRAIRGKEPLAQRKPEGALSLTTQAFFDNIRGVLAGSANNADKAVGLLDRLEQAAAKGKEDRASLKENLTALKAGLPAPKAPDPDKSRGETSL